MSDSEYSYIMSRNAYPLVTFYKPFGQLPLIEIWFLKIFSRWNKTFYLQSNLLQCKMLQYKCISYLFL